MKKRLYNIVSVLLFVFSITILAVIDKTNNVKLNIVIEILLILYLSKISYGCVIYIKQQFEKQKYSYSIIMNLGLVLFLIINIFRQLNLLITNFGKNNIVDIYNSIISSFSYFAIFILPIILIFAIYSIFTNIFLISKEGFKFQNLLGILFGIMVIFSAVLNQIVFEMTKNNNLFDAQILIKRFVDMSVNAILCYFYCIILSTIYCNIMAANHKPQYDKDFVIVLGAKIKKDGTLTPLLKANHFFNYKLSCFPKWSYCK